MTLDNPYGDVHEQKHLTGSGSQRLSSDKFRRLFDTSTIKHSDFRVGNIDEIRIKVLSGLEDYEAFVDNNPEILEEFNTSTTGESKYGYGKVKWLEHLDKKKNLTSIIEYQVPMTGDTIEYVYKPKGTQPYAYDPGNTPGLAGLLYGPLNTDGVGANIAITSTMRPDLEIPFGSTLEIEVKFIGMGDKYSSYRRYDRHLFEWVSTADQIDFDLFKLNTTTGCEKDAHAFTSRWGAFDTAGTASGKSFLISIKNTDLFNNHDTLNPSEGAYRIPFNIKYLPVVLPTVDVNINFSNELQTSPYIFCRASSSDRVAVTLLSSISGMTEATVGDEYTFDWTTRGTYATTGVHNPVVVGRSLGVSTTPLEVTTSMALEILEPSIEIAVSVTTAGETYGHPWSYTATADANLDVSLVIGPSTATDNIYIGPIVPEAAEDLIVAGVDHTSISLKDITPGLISAAVVPPPTEYPTYLIDTSIFDTKSWPSFEFNIAVKNTPDVVSVDEVSYSLEKYNNGGWVPMNSIPRTFVLNDCIKMSRDGLSDYYSIIERPQDNPIKSSAYRVLMKRNIEHVGNVEEDVCRAYSPTIYAMVVDTRPSADNLNPVLEINSVQSGSNIDLTWTPTSKPTFQVGDKTFTLDVTQKIGFFDKKNSTIQGTTTTYHNINIGGPSFLQNLAHDVGSVSIKEKDKGDTIGIFKAIEDYRRVRKNLDKDVELYAQVTVCWAGKDMWSYQNNEILSATLSSPSTHKTSDYSEHYSPWAVPAFGPSQTRRNREWEAFAESNTKELLSCTDVIVLDEKKREISSDIITVVAHQYNDVVGIGGKTWSTPNDIIDIRGCRKYGYGFHILNKSSYGSVVLAQYPSPENSWKAIISINDENLIGPHAYNFDLVCSYYAGTVYTEETLMTFSGTVDESRAVEYECVYNTDKTNYTGTGIKGVLKAGAAGKGIYYSEEPSGYDDGDVVDYPATITLTPFNSTIVTDMNSTGCNTTMNVYKILEFKGYVPHDMKLKFSSLVNSAMAPAKWSGNGKPSNINRSSAGEFYRNTWFNNANDGGAVGHHTINIYPINANDKRIIKYYWKKISWSNVFTASQPRLTTSGDINNLSSLTTLRLYHNESGEGYYNIEAYAQVEETI